MKYPLCLFLVLFALTGCSTNPVRIKTTAVDIPAPVTKAVLPAPDPVKTLPVQWIVINSDTLSPALCLTAKGYENLAKGQADTLRWAKETSEQLRYYRQTP